MGYKIAVVGAGIYGSVAAIKLAEAGHTVHLFDPLGAMYAASAINQRRVHSGYHYPRSAETISEILEAKTEFVEMFADSIIHGARHFYAIPKQGSLTSVPDYVRVMETNNLPLKEVHPAWMNFDFIEACWSVDEDLYDADRVRAHVLRDLGRLNVPFAQRRFETSEEPEYDFVIYATYGLSGSHLHLFGKTRFQVAEKILVRLPDELKKVALVVVDGPFTAFDMYDEETSLFGSARHTNHWTTHNESDPVPQPYAELLNRKTWEPVPFTRFQAMVDDAVLTAPAARDAEYLGSRFTMRIVEDSPSDDRRILHIGRPQANIFHIFSGKVVSAVKAARLIRSAIEAT